MRTRREDIPERLKPLRRWLWDEQYRLRSVSGPDAPRLQRLFDRIDPSWDWQQRLVEEPGLWLICLAYGHVPMDDQCDKPEHRFCLTCHRLTPNAVVAV